MPIIYDDEFGKITIRRSSAATQVKIKVAPDGSLRASLPMYAPVFLLKRLIKSSRVQIKSMLSSSMPEYAYSNGMKVGKSHTLSIIENSRNFNVAISGQQIIVKIVDKNQLSQDAFSKKIRESIIKALRIEAKSYLPKRLSYLAKKYDYDYTKVRFSHAGGRWGSCSSNGTISLNIALMKLPFELIDYVIFHELAHTKQMNHSQEFWKIVETTDPDYKIHRKNLKNQSPTI